MPFFKKAWTALSTPLGVESLGASAIANARAIEYPVKLETEVIGYISGQVGTSTVDSRTWYGAEKTRLKTFSTKYFKISSKGQVKTGYTDTTPDIRLPTLDLESVTQDTIDAFTHKTGLIIKPLNDIAELYTVIKRYENGNIPDLYITNPTANTSLDTGKTNAVNESIRIENSILTAVKAAAADAAAKFTTDPSDANAIALNTAYNTSGTITTDNLITILTAVNATPATQSSIDPIVLAARGEIPLLDNANKTLAFLKSVPITDFICSHENFDDKTVALLFMVYADRLDVHFIKKRSTVPLRKTTVFGDTHYISRSSKDILPISYSAPALGGGVDKNAMLEILNLICLPVSFKIADTTNNNITYGFRNRHTVAATLPHEATGQLIYPFTSDSSEVPLILGRADNRQASVLASAKFNNAPTIAKLTDLHGLLCDKNPVILQSGPCEAIQKNIEKLQAGQAGGRRSRKRMNKNKRASSRHSRRQRHGHNSRKRYSAGSKSKSGLKSKSASNRRRNQKQQQQRQ